VFVVVVEYLQAETFLYAVERFTFIQSDDGLIVVLLVIVISVLRLALTRGHISLTAMKIKGFKEQNSLKQSQNKSELKVWSRCSFDFQLGEMHSQDPTPSAHFVQGFSTLDHQLHHKH